MNAGHMSILFNADMLQIPAGKNRKQKKAEHT